MTINFSHQFDVSHQTTLLSQLRQQRPVVHNITNNVVANYVANGLLALGASPIMANAAEEMQELANISQALSINTGMLNTSQLAAILIAGQAANQAGIPVVLDPVGIGATSFRQQAVKQLLRQIHLTAIRGNAGEIATLGGYDWQMTGVDVGEGYADLPQVAREVAQHYHTTVIISGSTDIVADENHVVYLNNGSPLLTQVTGSGCLLSAICAAFLGVRGAAERPFNACIEAVLTYTIASELAEQQLIHQQGAAYCGAFAIALLDQLSIISIAELKSYQRSGDRSNTHKKDE